MFGTKEIEIMNDKYSDKELKRKYGLRPKGTPLFFPQELGYRCPNGHSNLTWSEFRECIWCYTCQKDFHYANNCVLIKDRHNPENLPKQPRIITGINNWTKDGNGFNDIPKNLLRRKLK